MQWLNLLQYKCEVLDMSIGISCYFPILFPQFMRQNKCYLCTFAYSSL